MGDVAIYGAGLGGECLLAAVKDWAMLRLEPDTGVFAPEVACFIDDDPAKQGKRAHGLPVFSWDDFLLSPCPYVISEVMNLAHACRLKIRDKIQAAGLRMPAVVEDGAEVADSAHVSDGSYVKAGAILGHRVELEMCVIVDNNAALAHHCRISEGVHVGVGCSLESVVRVGPLTVLGAGTVVYHGITVGASCLVAPGSVISENLPDYTLWRDGKVRGRVRQPDYEWPALASGS